MGYSSYEVLVNYHPVTILSNQDHIERLIYKTNKLDDELKEYNKLISEFILKNIEYKIFSYITLKLKIIIV